MRLHTTYSGSTERRDVGATPCIWYDDEPPKLITLPDRLKFKIPPDTPTRESMDRGLDE